MHPLTTQKASAIVSPYKEVSWKKDMDIETLEFRAACLQAARNFFITHHYLELDTPALAPALIPESCLEVFRTEYLKPFKTGADAAVPLFLVPSPEIFIKPIIAAHGRSVFQLSKCYRNGESVGHIHSPEFTMLEYYTMHADYKDSIAVTESFLQEMVRAVRKLPLADTELGAILSKPFLQLTMDEAFRKYAGFSLAEAETTQELAIQAEQQGLDTRDQYESWAWDDLYELLLVHCVEPRLPTDVPTALLDYPARVPCLAGERTENRTAPDGHPIVWSTKERWEVYVRGVELANCYTEARNADEINRYFSEEAAAKERLARVPHPVPQNFGEICARMPPCSGVAMGFDRLIMLLCGKKTIC